jgi:hypothetical protein
VVLESITFVEVDMTADVLEFKPLRLEEIRHRYEGEWVLIVNPIFNENLEVLEGEVWAHSTNAETIYRSLSISKGHPASIEYMGDLPEDFVAIL